MRVTYPVIFTEVENNILIEVPDLGIFTEANDEKEAKGTMADAIFMARDAIGINCISQEDQGEEVPAATPIENVDVSLGAFASEGKSIVSLVDVDLTEYRRRLDNKTVRRNVTLPNWLNVEAENAHINVSRVLQEALMSTLGVKRDY